MKLRHFQSIILILQAKAEMTLTLAAWAFVRNLKNQVVEDLKESKKQNTKHHALFMYTLELKLMVLRRMPIAERSGGN